MSPESRNAQAADAELAPRESKFADVCLFAKKFATKGRAIAAIGPSGSVMCRAMTRNIDFSQPGVIVELGAGTGAITKAIVERLQSHHRFIIVEIDPEFVDVLRERFPQYEVVRGDATAMGSTFEKIGVRQVKFVFSGLATAHLPLRGQVRLHRWLRHYLDPTGTYMQITFVPRIYLNYYRRHFHDVQYTPIWRNVPPGGVYACRKIRATIAPLRRPIP